MISFCSSPSVGHASPNPGQSQAEVQPKGVGGDKLQGDVATHIPAVHFLLQKQDKQLLVGDAVGVVGVVGAVGAVGVVGAVGAAGVGGAGLYQFKCISTVYPGMHGKVGSSGQVQSILGSQTGS